MFQFAHAGPKTGEVHMRERANSQLSDASSTASLCEWNSRIDTRRLLPEYINFGISNTYNLDYNLDRKLGAGASGNVVIGEDKVKPGRRVAVKEVLVNGGDPAEVRALRHEANVMKELDHPNICRILEYYESGRSFFFVMELLSGGELIDRIKEDHITESVALKIAQQIASALRYAHDKKVSHRDMKPENIIFVNDDRETNEIKVIDWGWSERFGPTGMRNSRLIGSYQAPEVLEGSKSCTEMCDLWSFGVIVYAMLSGCLPFWQEKESQRLRSMREESFPLHGDDWAAISNDAKDFIRTLLRRDPRQRMSSADAMQHPWIKDSQKIWQQQISDGSMRQVLDNLQKSTAKTLFYTVSMANIARNLDSSSIGDVCKVFKALDLNQDGLLSLEEMKSGFKKIYGAESSKIAVISELFRELDLDGSGTVDFIEFVAAGMGEEIVQRDEVLWTAFRQFDSNGDGKLQREEIYHVIHTCSTQPLDHKTCSDVVDELFHRYDKKKDGSIDFDEFKCVMRRGAPGDSVEVDMSADVEHPFLSQLGPLAEQCGSFRDVLRRPHPRCLGVDNSASRCFPGCMAKCTLQ